MKTGGGGQGAAGTGRWAQRERFGLMVAMRMGPALSVKLRRGQRDLPQYAQIGPNPCRGVSQTCDLDMSVQPIEIIPSIVRALLGFIQTTARLLTRIRSTVLDSTMSPLEPICLLCCTDSDSKKAGLNDNSHSKVGWWDWDRLVAASESHSREYSLCTGCQSNSL